MAEGDQPFVTYRTRLGLSIKPRTAFGWWATLGWTALLIPLTAGFAWIMASNPTDRQAIVATAGFIAGIAVWSVAMAAWMYRRSEVIDLRKRRETSGDKLFTCYRIGSSYRFVPRRAAGWWAIALWSLPVVLYSLALHELASRLDLSGGPLLPLVFLFGGLAVWFWALLRWLKPRSEMVNLDSRRD